MIAPFIIFFGMIILVKIQMFFQADRPARPQSNGLVIWGQLFAQQHTSSSSSSSSSSLSWLLKPPLIAVHLNYFSFEGIVSLIDTGPSNNGYNNGLLCILRQLPKNPIQVAWGICKFSLFQFLEFQFFPDIEFLRLKIGCQCANGKFLLLRSCHMTYLRGNVKIIRLMEP